MNRQSTGIGALLLAAAMMNVAYTMLVPLVPELTDRFQMSALEVAAAFSGFALAKALAQPLGGYLVDATARPRLLGAIGLSLTAATIVGLAFATAGWQVLGWRFAWGAAEGITMPVLYQLASSLGASSRFGTARVMGWFGGSCTAGMVLGPAVIGLLYPFLGFTGVFLAGAAVTAIGGALLLGLRITEVDEPESVERAVAAGLNRRAVRSLAVLVGLFAVVDLINNALFAALEPVVPLHLDDLTGDGVAYTSVIFTAGLAVFMLGATFGGRLVESRPLLGVVVVAFAVEAVGLAAVGLFDGVVAMSAGLLLFMIAEPVLYLVARQGVSLVPRQLRGRAFGAFGLVSDIGFIVGPLLGAVAYAGLGTTVFLIMAALAAVAAVAAAPLRGLPTRLLATVHPDQDTASSPVGKSA